jgi:hypothetical protein
MRRRKLYLSWPGGYVKRNSSVKCNEWKCNVHRKMKAQMAKLMAGCNRGEYKLNAAHAWNYQAGQWISRG